MPGSAQHVTYTSAGGVVMNIDGKEILLLVRPSRDEVRLPKGHVEEHEDLQQAALREVQEEAGYAELEIVADLGRQLITFPLGGQVVHRTEHYFLMRAQTLNCFDRPEKDTEQFFPVWVSWEEAEEHLTFEAERVWTRRARKAWKRAQ